MKKVMLTILVFIMLLPFIVKASSCDAESITIESITLEDSTGNASEKSSATVSNNNINIDLNMNNVGDSITYKIDVRNNSEEDMEINEETFNVNESEYIKYSLETEDASNIIKANSSKVVFLSIKYINEIPDEAFESGTFIDTNVVKLDVSNNNVDIGDVIDIIVNPKTGDSSYILLLIIMLIISFSLFLVLKKKSAFMIIIIAFVVIPISIYSLCKSEINIDSKITIKNISEFDIGEKVEWKMHMLSNNEPIQSIIRSDNLPDDVKNQVDYEKSTYNNIVISAEEYEIALNEAKSDVEYIIEYQIKLINNINYYCITYEDEEFCETESEMIEWLSNSDYYIVYNPNNDKYYYFVYNAKENKVEVLSEEEFKPFFTEHLIERKKETFFYNVLSSKESKKIIYGWYDNQSNSINYYCNDEEVYLNEDSSAMFKWLYDLKEAPGMEHVNTSIVKNMNEMFCYTGKDAASVSFDLSSWDVSNVTNIENMFNSAFSKAETVDINLSGWKFKSTNSLAFMFDHLANKSSSLKLNLTDWDISHITSLRALFNFVGEESYSWNVLGLSDWDTSNVINMNGVFQGTGNNVSSYQLDLSNWDVSSVEDMSFIFSKSGTNATSWSVGDLSNWNTSKVETLYAAFQSVGYKANELNISYVSNWNTSKVKDMKLLFHLTGYQANSCSILDLSNWDVSNVENMTDMFSYFCHHSSLNIGDLSNWDTSKVTSMKNMFSNVARFTNINSLNIYADDIEKMFENAKVDGSINIYKKPSNYAEVFKNAASANTNALVVNYSSEVTNIDDIIDTKSSNSNVTKGELLD